MVREVDPPSPSTRLSKADDLPGIAASRGLEPAQLRRALRGDLDWIALKALEKDRGGGYETANAFAADVMRQLASEPVLAAPPSRAYRMRKFVRKHRGAVVAAGFVVFTLAGRDRRRDHARIDRRRRPAAGARRRTWRSPPGGTRSSARSSRGWTRRPITPRWPSSAALRNGVKRAVRGTGRCGDRRPARCCGHAGQARAIAHRVGRAAGCDRGPEEIPRDPKTPTRPRSHRYARRAMTRPRRGATGLAGRSTWPSRSTKRRLQAQECQARARPSRDASVHESTWRSAYIRTGSWTWPSRSIEETLKLPRKPSSGPNTTDSLESMNNLATWPTQYARKAGPGHPAPRSDPQVLQSQARTRPPRHAHRA